MNDVYKIVNSLRGNVLIISNDIKISEIANKNNNLNEVFILSNNTKKSKAFGLNSTDGSIYIGKIRKSFKKKSIDTIVCDYNLIKKYMNTFVMDSIYLNNGFVYFYNSSKEINGKYLRYGSKIEEGKVLKIDNTN